MKQFYNLYYFKRDNPDVDIRGANTYREYLHLENKRNESNKSITIESILVSTGVYNPKNDLLYHLTHLFDEALAKNNKSEEEQEEEESDESSFSSNTLFLKVSSIKSRSSSSLNLVDKDKIELKSAMSRKNSFISYFDNKLNVPDLTVGNLLDAVNHIISNL
jgi:hypothetical protein